MTRAYRLWWTRKMLPVVGPPPRLSQRALDELLAVGPDYDTDEWAQRIGCTVLEVRYALAWLGGEGGTVRAGASRWS